MARRLDREGFTVTALHKASGVCEECYEAEEFGTTPPHTDGHCWTAADLMAHPALRQLPNADVTSTGDDSA
jgi:hypothetical protein